MSTNGPRLRQVGLAAAVTGTALVTALAPAGAALAAPSPQHGQGERTTPAGSRAGDRADSHQAAGARAGSRKGAAAQSAQDGQGATSGTRGQAGTSHRSAAGSDHRSATGESHRSATGESHRSATGESHRSTVGTHGRSAAAHDASGPAGNNGTIKIHQMPGDTAHHNQPHVSCTFYLDFFGFDGGQTATIDFVGQAPTGPGTALLHEAGVPIDPASSRGTGATWDSELGFTTDPAGGSGLTYLPVTDLGAPQPQQGYHVKVLVDADGAPGGAKQKVFWIQPCATSGGGSLGGNTGGSESGSGSGSTGSGSTGSGSTGSGSGATGSGSSTGSGSGAATGTSSASGSGAAVLGASAVTGSAAATTGTRVLGEKFVRPTLAVAGDAAGDLPYTGAEVGSLAAAALTSLGAGAGLVVAARRRRGAASAHTG